MNFTEMEILTKTSMESNIEYFNRNRRKGKLAISYYVNDGNKADIYKDGKRIVSCLTIEQASAAVLAISNYENANNNS